MEIYQTVLVAAATGFFSAFGTGIAMKTDIAWIKEIIKSHESRLATIENKGA
ncbi:hypothetical protein ACFFLZ_06450 [Photobacterium aphoticum]|uniref:Uncharacterized protein n=1 Tax=Photobacterium aphoticum TaxID=754436 RepID=A0A090R5R6_9GAMM|nr:hypothetical protein [Photobacterium aphoticum]GAL02962.1 hypothetical protein JCM19237_5855 [Photobacterium aphoticum]GHA34336.1 hypothetical protein GCM10007086_04750 [Photobacterium aphoticum]